LTVDRSWGRFDAALSGLAEMPLNESEKEETRAEEGEQEKEAEGGKYDEVDVLISAAASYGVTDWMRLGVETVLEDMEGFWEDEEAEGGAKLVAGPTMRLDVVDGFSARLNAAAVTPLTSSQPTRVADASRSQTRFLGRLALGYRF
jgi:hypothetical protein